MQEDWGCGDIGGNQKEGLRHDFSEPQLHWGKTEGMT